MICIITTGLFWCTQGMLSGNSLMVLQKSYFRNTLVCVNRNSIKRKYLAFTGPVKCMACNCLLERGRELKRDRKTDTQNLLQPCLMPCMGPSCQLRFNLPVTAISLSIRDTQQSYYCKQACH